MNHLNLKFMMHEVMGAFPMKHTLPIVEVGYAPRLQYLNYVVPLESSMINHLALCIT